MLVHLSGHAMDFIHRHKSQHYRQLFLEADLHGTNLLHVMCFKKKPSTQIITSESNFDLLQVSCK